MPNRLKEIQKRLVLALKYYRIANRLTANEITENNGVNFYLIESGKRPISIATIMKLEDVFGVEAVSNLLNHAWHGEGDWKEESLMQRIRMEQEKWDNEKKLEKAKKNKK
ncbi:MAG: helix-turn-helix transcriptional regulator [Bacteroidetes bacterium]|nr:helix-turn-helix transcriptional regulator [Bacteroidota bacterium]